MIIVVTRPLHSALITAERDRYADAAFPGDASPPISTAFHNKK